MDSSNPAVASVGSATGIVTGIASGIPTITYTLPTGCTSVANVTVNACSSDRWFIGVFVSVTQLH